MLIPQVVLMAFLLCHGMSANFKMDVKVYKWDEKIKICSPDFNILTDVICANDQVADQSIMRRIFSKTRSNVYTECCKNTCMPLEILTYYCQHPERVNVTNDLKVYNMLNDPGTTSPTTTTQKPESFSVNKLMYCYFGIMEHCNEVLNEQVGSLIDTIAWIHGRR